MTGTKKVFAPHDDSSPTSELVGQNKFAVTWPAESSPSIQSPLAHSVDRPAVLSSSEGDSDVSERDLSSYNDRLSQAELSDEYDTSHSSRRAFQPQFVARSNESAPDTPRLSRTFSAPLPSQLEHLRNPHRSQSILPLSTSVQTMPEALNDSYFNELSLELADSVEMVVQTLLQISPAQILDPAREQYAACSMSVPTSCISGMLTTVKNLNFMSANMPDLYPPAGRTIPQAGNGALVPLCPPHTQITPSDFDIGELLQGVGDALSGCAASRGVQLVIFHADNGLRHVAVRGEEFGVCNTLTHVIRQVLHVARPGDTIDVGLSIRSLSGDSSESPTETESSSLRSNKGSDDGYLRCVFEINHYFSPPDASEDVATPIGQDARPRPNIGSPLLQRLRSRTGASLNADLPVRVPFRGRACELAFLLERGSAAAIDAKTTPMSEYCTPLLSWARITTEPTLEELVQFSETLRGKKAALYAKESSAFAHHLTSYLTTWGMDVSHLPSESEADGVDEKVSSAETSPGAAAPPAKPRQWNPADTSSHDNPGTMTNGTSRTGPTFVFIDDDVSVLRERIRKDRAELHPIPISVHSRGKRPSLAAHHRPKSSPQIVRALGYGSLTSSQSIPVIVHFTSLANYKVVKDIVQTEFAFSSEAFLRAPLDIMIIPKPAGPRRFLTALHTAITKPVVDPLFTPIATSPMSPGIHSPPLFSSSSTPKSPPSRPSYSPRTTSDRSVKSPRDGTGEPHVMHPPSPLAISETAEYFPDSVKLGMSPASGLVIQSPDGQPAGIVFQPRAKGTKASGTTTCIDMPKPQFLIPVPERARRAPSRRASSSEDRAAGQPIVSFSTYHSPGPGVPLPYRQDSLPSPESQTPPSSAIVKGKARKPSVLADDVSAGPSVPTWKGNSVEVRKMASPPGSPKAPDPPSNTFSRRQSRRAQDQKPANPPAMSTKPGKTTTETTIIPPISVLIVDDNPINQTILSTFMRKKKIKYDVAKNGEEAVQKWRSGDFHLILMDIQMPVMDGIQATKEIRQLERFGGPSTPQSDTSLRTPSEGATPEPRASPYRSSVIIVALTASSLQSDRVAALAAGCNDFLTKPVSLQWLNNKIIEWGSIKALQMWADIRPEAARKLSTEQTVQAQNVARRLHVPEGRATPINHSPSRSSSMGKTEGFSEVMSGISLVSSANVPLSEQRDAVLKLSERTRSMTNGGQEQTDNKHEGAVVSSPVIDTATIPDNADKLPPPTSRSGSDSSLSSSSSEGNEPTKSTVGGSGELPPSASSGGHDEPRKIP